MSRAPVSAAAGVPERRRPASAAPGRLRIAVRSSVVAAAVLAGTLALIAEIAAEQTAVTGIRSSTWTPLTAVATLVLGDDAFRGSFAFPEIAVGTALLTGTATALGLLGVAWIRTCAGSAPPPALAAALGMTYGLAIQVGVVNAAINATGDIVYRALPPWGWWAAMAAYGATLGLAESRSGRRP